MIIIIIEKTKQKWQRFNFFQPFCFNSGIWSFLILIDLTKTKSQQQQWTKNHSMWWPIHHHSKFQIQKKKSEFMFACCHQTKIIKKRNFSFIQNIDWLIDWWMNGSKCFKKKIILKHDDDEDAFTNHTHVCYNYCCCCYKILVHKNTHTKNGKNLLNKKQEKQKFFHSIHIVCVCNLIFWFFLQHFSSHHHHHTMKFIHNVCVCVVNIQQQSQPTGLLKQRPPVTLHIYDGMMLMTMWISALHHHHHFVPWFNNNNNNPRTY